MTIASEITRINNNIASAYTAVNNKGGTLPATQNSANLATAIDSIPSGSTPTLITKTITQNGTYNASSDNADGYSSVTVNVSGGSGYTELPSYQVSNNGVASRRSGALTGNEFSNIINVSDYGMYLCFSDKNITGSLNLSSIISIGEWGMNYCFRNNIGLISIDLSGLTTVSNYGLYGTFYGCIGITTANVGATSVYSQGAYQLFRGCTGLKTVYLSNLTNAGSSCFSYCFQSCTSLEDVYFNSLTTTSFGSYKNQFNYMLSSTGTSVTHTLHFPSNLQSTISGLKGYPTFGGTSGYVVCAFDLPATS